MSNPARYARGFALCRAGTRYEYARCDLAGAANPDSILFVEAAVGAAFLGNAWGFGEARNSEHN